MFHIVQVQNPRDNYNFFCLFCILELILGWDFALKLFLSGSNRDFMLFAYLSSSQFMSDFFSYRFSTNFQL